jgi:hypothetical protein
MLQKVSQALLRLRRKRARRLPLDFHQFMTEKELLQEYGLVPEKDLLPSVRQLLAEQTEIARTKGGNEPLLRLLCIQLFAHGDVNDVLAIWVAKRSNSDAGFGIDVQLLCGAGLNATKEYLKQEQSSEAAKALSYLEECEKSGDFRDWSPQKHLEFWRKYYKL